MPKLTFKFIADDESQFHETRALIDGQDYDSSIEAAAKDASWETPGRRAEKRIEQLDFTGCFSDGKPLIWVSTREKQDHILMLFGTQYQQELVELPWSPKDEEHAVASVRAWIESRANKVRE